MQLYNVWVQLWMVFLKSDSEYLVLLEFIAQPQCHLCIGASLIKNNKPDSNYTQLKI